MDAALEHSASSKKPSSLLQVGSVLLPIIKCAVCPVCLSAIGGLFAGARMGFLADESVHGAVLLVALAADFLILGSAIRHHKSRGPLFLCIGGGALALGGHFAGEAIEYLGFALLIGAAIWNLVLLRRHRSDASGCCAHHPAT